MHMRTKKWALPELRECSWYTDAPAQWRGQWRERFGREAPLYVELGCGKGIATANMAKANPEINYLALDISSDILGVARRMAVAAYDPQPVNNLILVKQEIEQISEMLAPQDQVQRLYIRFCNPWSQKPRQYKHRLTHPRQLVQYREFLAPGGEIWFKTDDLPLFEDSLKYFDVCGFEKVYETRDLTNSGFTPNYISEHERMFIAQGLPIYFAIVRKKEGALSLDPVAWGREEAHAAAVPTLPKKHKEKEE